MEKIIFDKLPPELRDKISASVFLRSSFHELIHSITHTTLLLLKETTGLDFSAKEPLLDGIIGAAFETGYHEAELQQAKAEKAEFKNEEEEAKTLDNIDTYAGSFVKQMGTCYRMADPLNKRKFRYTFWNYFQKYLPEKWTSKEGNANG